MAKKQFKLVYVKNGALCGSYSGVPGKDDVTLITRAALEGFETPIPEGYVVPEGVLEITENGEVDIAAFKKVIINVAGQVPTGSIEITTNGEHNVAGKATANVNVPIPAGYVLPQGSIDITTNGDNIDVTNKALVNVNVPSSGYPEPTGKAPTITANGTNINIKNYATVDVNVPKVQMASDYPAKFYCPVDTSHSSSGYSYSSSSPSIYLNIHGDSDSIPDGYCSIEYGIQNNKAGYIVELLGSAEYYGTDGRNIARFECSKTNGEYSWDPDPSYNNFTTYAYLPLKREDIVQLSIENTSGQIYLGYTVNDGDEEPSLADLWELLAGDQDYFNANVTLNVYDYEGEYIESFTLYGSVSRDTFVEGGSTGNYC